MMQIIKRHEGWVWYAPFKSYLYFGDEVRCGGKSATESQEIVMAPQAKQLG